MGIMLTNTKVMDYLSDVYIDEDSTFPPKIWTENLLSIQIMTNAWESYSMLDLINRLKHIKQIFYFYVLKYFQLNTFDK